MSCQTGRKFFSTLCFVSEDVAAASISTANTWSHVTIASLDRRPIEDMQLGAVYSTRTTHLSYCRNKFRFLKLREWEATRQPGQSEYISLIQSNLFARMGRHWSSRKLEVGSLEVCLQSLPLYIFQSGLALGLDLRSSRRPRQHATTEQF